MDGLGAFKNVFSYESLILLILTKFEGGRATIYDLGRVLGVSKSTLFYNLSKLQMKQLVNVEGVYVQLTQKGADIVERFRKTLCG